MFFQFWIRSVQRFSLPHSLAYLLSLALACSLAHLLALSCSLALSHSLPRSYFHHVARMHESGKAVRGKYMNIFWVFLYFCFAKYLLNDIVFVLHFHYILIFCFFKLVSSLRCIFHMHKEHDSSSVHPASTPREASAAVDDSIPWLGEGAVDGLKVAFILFL